MHVEFSERPDGQIDAHLVGNWNVFNEALADAISTRPPKGAPDVRPSTYWIDVAQHGLAQALEHKIDRPFTWGNTTYLRVDDDRVVAAFDFDPGEDEAESMPVQDFIDLSKVGGRWSSMFSRRQPAPCQRPTVATRSEDDGAGVC